MGLQLLISGIRPLLILPRWRAISTAPRSGIHLWPAICRQFGVPRTVYEFCVPKVSGLVGLTGDYVQTQRRKSGPINIPSAWSRPIERPLFRSALTDLENCRCGANEITSPR
jgi:hypothetical protein